MRVGVIGTGYVGSVTGACLAEKGNDVICMDNNPEKVELMRNGGLPIYEPGLDEVFKSEISEGRLHFTTSLDEAMEGTDVLFLALPTPQGENDEADLSYILGAAKDIGKRLTSRMVIVDKSTVPIGTSRWVTEVIEAETRTEFEVVSNPEFLREGRAVDDFRYPHQIVVGTKAEWAEEIMRELYEPFVRRTGTLDFMDPYSAETVKYGINAFLAVKISFANELAQLCKATGADYNRVRMAVGRDTRIGDEFMFAGPGWGGSCFPKDTRAVVKIAEKLGIDLGTVKAAIESNERQKRVVPEEVIKFFDGDLSGRRLALWGLAFKDKTDDIRESPALSIADQLTERGAEVVAFDPQAMNNVRKARASNSLLTYAETDYEALEGVDALVIATNWDEFSTPDFRRMHQAMRQPVIFDGRNMYKPAAMKQRGFYYNALVGETVDGRIAA